MDVLAQPLDLRQRDLPLPPRLAVYINLQFGPQIVPLYNRFKRTVGVNRKWRRYRESRFSVDEGSGHDENENHHQEREYPEIDLLNQHSIGSRSHYPLTAPS